MSAAAEHHDDHHGLSHVAPVKVLVATGGTLLLLTIVTVLATKVDFGGDVANAGATNISFLGDVNTIDATNITFGGDTTINATKLSFAGDLPGVTTTNIDFNGDINSISATAIQFGGDTPGVTTSVKFGRDTQVITVAIFSEFRQFGSNLELIAPAAFISLVIPLGLFFAFQRYFVEGVLLGGTKG